MVGHTQAGEVLTKLSPSHKLLPEAMTSPDTSVVVTDCGQAPQTLPDTGPYYGDGGPRSVNLYFPHSSFPKENYFVFCYLGLERDGVYDPEVTNMAMGCI